MVDCEEFALDGAGAGAVVRLDVDVALPVGVPAIDVVRVRFATDDGEPTVGAVWEKISSNGVLLGDEIDFALAV